MVCIKKIVVAIFVGVLSLAFSKVLAQSTTTRQTTSNVVSLISELKPFYDITDLPAYQDQTIVGQISSYDTTAGNDDGFSGKYSYLRKLPDSSLVVFDVKGPGVINRIWTPTPSDDSLDFYIDDTAHAAFTIKYRDLFSGKTFPFVAPLCNNQLGGYYCYLPIPFQQRCIIVYRGKQTQFHQIGYRSYPEATKVKKFDLNLNGEEKLALEKIKTLWDKRNPAVKNFQGVSATPYQSYKTNFQLKPGEQHTLLQTNKGGRIVGIELGPASSFEGLFKGVDIRITWDNEAHPAVYCPVADFFGYAFGKTSMQSLLVGSADNKNYCYFPMPFDKSAKIELVYRKSKSPVTSQSLMITASIFYSPQARQVDKEGKFYAYWNNESKVPLHQPHQFLDVSGKGHYVGTVLQAKGLEPGMTTFFEGDDSTVVDGQLRMHGTGSEDYFNGGWYAMMDRWDGPFSLPLSGALDYSLPLNRTGGYRLFLTDKIPFTKSLYHSIEHGPERNEKPASYTSVAYYYSNTSPKTTIPPVSEETTVSVQDTLVVYPQLLTFNNAGDIGIQHVWVYPTGGDSFIFSSTGQSGLRVHLAEVPNGSYKVFLDYAKIPAGCSFSLWQRQTPLTGWRDSHAADTTRVEQEHLANVSLTNLNHTITIQLKGADERNKFFINRLILVRNKE